jgi:hypothetical protein
MAFNEVIADVSLPVMRDRSNPGTAIAAMMLIIATTIRSSMSVKPRSECFVIGEPSPTAYRTLDCTV